MLSARARGRADRILKAWNALQNRANRMPPKGVECSPKEGLQNTPQRHGMLSNKKKDVQSALLEEEGRRDAP